MNSEYFNRDKCHQRNRLAARRDGVDAAPMLLLKGTPPSADESKLQTAKGKLPATDAEALALINADRPGLAPLTEDDVYIHYLEAANSNYVGDRFLFLDPSTLRNIADDAAAGFAFMNSHRTGGLSSPSELPFGRTFAGRYEMAKEPGGDISHRTIVAFYMLRGVQPNGAGGPSTDDLHRSIDAGTIFDCSVGLRGGDFVCDVCGEDLDAMKPGASPWDDDAYLCPHVPGTTEKMTKDEIAAQKARNVPGGTASYSYVGAHCGEVSAVYDGAVPGAGFRKSLSFAHHRQLSAQSLREAKASYSTLSSKGDYTVMDNIAEAIKEGFAQIGARFQSPSEPPGPVPTPLPPPVASAVYVAAGSELGASAKDILALCASEGVQTATDLKAKLDLAKIGSVAEADLRADAEQQAIRAYGVEIGQDLAQSCKILPFAQVKQIAAGWRTEADKKFGIGADGTAASRKSAAPATPVALSAEHGDEDKNKRPWEMLSADQHKQAAMLGVKGRDAEDDFAATYFESKEGAH